MSIPLSRSFVDSTFDPRQGQSERIKN